VGNVEHGGKLEHDKSTDTWNIVFVFVGFCLLGHREVSDRIIKGTANSALGQEHAGERERERRGKGKERNSIEAERQRDRKSINRSSNHSEAQGPQKERMHMGITSTPTVNSSSSHQTCRREEKKKRGRVGMVWA